MNKSFMQKLHEWYGGKPKPAFMKALDGVVDTYKECGRTDAQKGREPLPDDCFLGLGGFCFPNAPAMAAAMAEYIKACYMKSYSQA